MILIRPIITERTLAESGKNRYTFEVNKNSTKTEIKNAVEKTFGLKVLRVHTITMPGKSYRTGKRWLIKQTGKRKKAIVTAEPGKTIDLFEVTKQNQ